MAAGGAVVAANSAAAGMASGSWVMGWVVDGGADESPAADDDAWTGAAAAGAAADPDSGPGGREAGASPALLARALASARGTLPVAGATGVVNPGGRSFITGTAVAVSVDG